VNVLKIAFMGTPEFAVPSLDMLVKEGYTVEMVVTQPDKPKGRGKRLTASPVKEYAQKSSIPILQPEKVKTPEFIATLRKLKPDLIVTVAYGKILSRDILDIPPLGCINVHGSLLPKYRGAAPIHWAIINGEAVSGITTMFTDEGMDTGDILLKKEVEIYDEMTAGDLHDILSVVGADVLRDTLKRLESGTLKRIRQCDEEATYAPMIKKDTGLIDWAKSAIEIHNLVRGTNPWPVAFTFYKDKRMKIWKTKVIDVKSSGPEPGTICKACKDGLIVSAGTGMLKVLEIQFDSCRTMSIDECWHNLHEGEILG
jgi:methionyl-tRNA formyltransferase